LYTDIYVYAQRSLQNLHILKVFKGFLRSESIQETNDLQEKAETTEK